MKQQSRIVVGVDGSPLDHALAFAIEEARLRHGHLHVTYATGHGKAGHRIDRQGLLRTGRAEAASSWRASCRARRDRRTRVEWLAVRATPPSLIEASRGAALLVVGSRGVVVHGLMMGSVSTQCVHIRTARSS